MLEEPGYFTYPVIKRLVTGQQRLQGTHLAPGLWANGDAIRDRVTALLAHGIAIHRIPAQVAVFGIRFQKALPLQTNSPGANLDAQSAPEGDAPRMTHIKAADPIGDGVRQLGEFGAGRRLEPAEPGCSIGTLNAHAIEEQHVKVDKVN